MSEVALDLLKIAAFLALLAQVACLVVVLVRMFQEGRVAWAVACIALLLCCGLGGQVAFVHGWTLPQRGWTRAVMVMWAVCMAVAVVAVALVAVNTDWDAARQHRRHHHWHWD